MSRRDIFHHIPDIKMFFHWTVFNWPYSGHRLLMFGIRTVMSGIWTVMSRIWTETISDVCIKACFTVHIPDINFLIKLMYGIRTVRSGIWTLMSRTWTVMSGIWTMMSGIGTKYLSLFRTSKVDVQNMDSENWPYSEHRELMSGIRTVFSVHISDIKS